jgi:hypothetical protein
MYIVEVSLLAFDQSQISTYVIEILNGSFCLSLVVRVPVCQFLTGLVEQIRVKRASESMDD